MGQIKGFIYLDEYKMYSLSSQIFEGITEYLIDYKSGSTDQTQSQKGHIGSGHIFADILKSEWSTAEKKYLHDDAYQIFEEHLCNIGKVTEIDLLTSSNLQESIGDSSFVKVKAKAVFNDIRLIMSTTQNFNSIGEALTYVTNIGSITEAKQQLDQVANTIRNPKQKSKLKQQASSLLNINQLAKESGLHFDPVFLERLAYLLKYGFQDQFEIQMPLAVSIFSANLKRGCLKEEEDLLIRKYSRITEKEFVLFGIVTQSSNQPLNIPAPADSPPTSVKEAVMNMITLLTNMESSFTGRLPNEIIIDPIALYREL